MHKSLQGYIMNTLRRGWSRSYSRRMCLSNAKTEYFAGNRRRVHFKCACCGEFFDFKAVQVDHIIPVLNLTGFDNWEAVIERMYVGPEGLQVLCTTCHKAKSASEAGTRALARRSKGEDVRANDRKNKKAQKQAEALSATSDVNVRPVRVRTKSRRKLGSAADGADGATSANSEQPS